MERIEAELFTDGSNNAVVRLRGRRFPGVLIQGDTLANLRAELAEAQEACIGGNLEEARESVAFVLLDLDSLLERYVKALEAHGMQLPFRRAS